MDPEPTEPDEPDGPKKKNGVYIAIGILIGFVIAVVICAVVVLVLRKRQAPTNTAAPLIGQKMYGEIADTEEDIEIK